MKALLIYSKIDYDRNKEYIKWIQKTASDKNVDVLLIFFEDIMTNGVCFDDIAFVINRSRSYEISLLFELNSIKVFNNSTITLLGNNKLACYHYAKLNGYKFPEIYISWKDKKDVISKPNFGHGGYGIGFFNDIDTNDKLIRFQQEFYNDLVGDIRFYIIGNEIIHAVLRRNNNKIVSNFSQGGEIELYNYSASEKEFVKGFINGLDIDYAGVDFLLTSAGELIFNEIEDVVGSRMLSYLGINNTTEQYINHIINKMQN